MRLLRLLCVLAAVATLTAACGDDDGTTAEDSTTTTTAEPPTGDDTSDVTAPDDSTVTTTLPELFDSAPGVTADSIKLGVVYVDLEAVSDFVDLDHGSYEAAYRAVIENVNDNGGVLGRMIEPVFAPINVLDPAGADAACLRLVEDDEVFAVMGNVQAAQLPCYVDLGETPFIGSTPTDELEERARAPWFSVQRNADEATRTIIEGFAERGVFDGATVGVVVSADDEALMTRTAVPTLAELGVSPSETAVISTPIIFPDEIEIEVGIIAERMRAEGIDVVLALGGAVTSWTRGTEDLGYTPRIATTSLGSMRVFIRDRIERDFTILEGAVAGNQAEQLKWWDDPLIQECIGLVEAAGEPTILDPNTRAADEPENIVSVNAACGHVSLFVAIAEKAGVDLTPESFLGAGESLGEHTVPGYGLGNWTAEAHDGDLPIFFYEWDDSAQDLLNDGETLG